MTRGRLAWVLAATAVVVFFAVTVIDPYPDYGATVLYAVMTAAYVVIGAFLVNRVPTNPIGALMLLSGTFGVASAAVGIYADVGALQTPPWQGVGLARTIGEVRIIYPVMVALVGIPLVYPDGHLPSRRFRWVVLLTITGMVGSFLGSIFNVDLDVVLLVSVPIAFGGAVTAVILRFRGGDAVQRQQVKWLAAVVIVGAAAFVSGLLIVDTFPDVSDFLITIGIAAVLAMPFVVGMAILRYRLYEIDRIISRTLAYLLITAVLVGAYAALVILLGGPLAGLGGGDTISVALSTLVVAALFQPLRRRVQSLVDRRFDRARYDGQRLADAFAGRLRDEVDIATVTADLDATVRAAVRPSTTTLWVRGHDR
jgi:hypothetical protein